MYANKYYAGAISGIFEVVLTHPLDFLKTKRQEMIQSNLNPKDFYKNILDKGPKIFYSGLLSRLTGIIPMRLTFWGVQGNINDYLNDNKIKTPINFLLIGTLGGFTQSVIDNQIELIKISQMTGKKLKFNDFIKFTGFTATMIRNIGFANCIAYSCFNVEAKTSEQKFINSATAGFIGSVITQPFDYIKTIKHRVDPTFINGKNIKILNTFEILNIIYRNNPKSLFTGVGARSGLSFFSMGIGFVAYDKINNLLKN